MTQEKKANSNYAALAQIVFDLYAPGTKVYAILSGRIYSPAKDSETRAPLELTPEVIEHHLAGQQSVGVYPIAPGQEVCHFAVLDFDDHQGTLGWNQVRNKAQVVGQALLAEGLSFVAFRSGGGKGIHLLVPFVGAVNAAALRKELHSILIRLGLTSGTGGVEMGQVEIFPKQDRVPVAGIGNLIALPLARKSVLLDHEFNEVEGNHVLRMLRAFVKNPTDLVPIAATTERVTSTAHIDVEDDLTTPGEHPLSQCQFMQHCADHAQTLAEPLWLAAATNAAKAPGGRAYFHFLSKLDPSRYDAPATDRKFDHAMTLQPFSCLRLVDDGFPCPKMAFDGTCTVTSGMNPVSFAVPTSKLIESLRSAKPIHVRHRRIAAVIKARLIANGAFFVSSQDQEQLYFERTERRLYKLGSDAFAAYISDKFGLNGAEHEFKFVQADLETHASRYGALKHVHRVACFANEVLYVDAGAQQMYRLDGKTIAALPNGDDGVLFRDSDRIEPFTFDAAPGTGHVRRYLTDQLHTDDADLKDLFYVYLHSLYFERLLPTKPIALITGEKGSGKSFVGRAIKKVIFGAKADVDVGVTADEGSARAAFTHNYFVCMDNVDGMVDWLANLLASVSTGAVIRMRTLYKTNDESEFEPHCFVMINSRDPVSLRRDDIADRLLIFGVTRRKTFVPESQLHLELLGNRQAILSELLFNLNKVVAQLKKPAKAVASAHRLADFAALSGIIARALHLPGAERAIEKMDEKRNKLVLDGDPLVSALLAYTVDPTRPEWITTGALFVELREYMDMGRATARSFGRKLKNLQSNLRSHLGIEWRDGQHNSQEVKLTPTPKAKADLAQRFGFKAAPPLQGKQVNIPTKTKIQKKPRLATHP